MKLKRIIHISVLTAVFLLVLIPAVTMHASAAPGREVGVEGGCAWVYENGVLTISPSEHGESGAQYGKTIGNHAYAGGHRYPTFNHLSDWVETIIIEPGVINLGQGLFNGFDKVREVYIPISVSWIEAGVFNGCDKLCDVYYSGTPALWDQISFTGIEYAQWNNIPLFLATMHYDQQKLASVINEVAVNLTDPVAGATIKTDGVSNNNTVIYQQGWYKSKNLNDPATGKFQNGGTYWYSALIKPLSNEAYERSFAGTGSGLSGVIASSVVYAKIGKSVADEIYWYSGGISSLGISDATGWIRVWKKYEINPTSIRLINFYFTTPKPGEAAIADGRKLSGGWTAWSIYDQGWYTSRSANTNYPMTGTFKNGVTYYYSALLKPDDGYVFPGTADGKDGKLGEGVVDVYNNGNLVTDIEWFGGRIYFPSVDNGYGWIRIWVPVRCEGPVFGPSVDVYDLKMPKHGDAISNGDVSLDSHSSLSWESASWSRPSGSGGRFTRGEYYLWEATVSLTDGSRFRDNHSVYVNGIEVPVITGAEALVYTLAKKPYSGVIINNDKMSIVLGRICGEHMVNFYANGGEGSMEAVSVPEGEYTIPMCDFAPPEYKDFANWGRWSEEYLPGETIDITEDINLNAVWQQAKWTVTFRSNGGSGSMEDAIFYPNSYPSSRTLELPSCGFTAPKGRSFDGWQVNGKPCKPGDKVEVSRNLYIIPIWKAGAGLWTVTFLPNGGSGSMASVSVTTGTEWALPGCTFEPPSGMGFKGWELDGTLYHVGDKVKINSDTAIKALWDTGRWTVSFDSNGGDGAMNPITVSSGEYKLPESKFTPPKNAVFDRWNLGAAGDIVNISANTKLVAMWRGIRVSFDAGGGSGNMADVVLEPGVPTYTLPASCGFKPPAGKVFDDWKVYFSQWEFEAGWGIPYRAGSKLDVDFYDDDGIIILQPSWKARTGYLVGDVDGNEEVNSKDLTVLARHVAGIQTITDAAALKSADVNNDGDVNSKDLTLLAKYVAGIITSF